jgi:hypothetical protein
LSPEAAGKTVSLLETSACAADEGVGTEVGLQ